MQKSVCWLVLAVSVAWPGVVSAQVVESVGSRALGMGGAFVAVANDSSASWWNPGGLGAGPFVDLALARAVVEQSGELPAVRDRTSSFALGTPPFGFSYYKYRVTGAASPTAQDRAGRQDGETAVPLTSLSASQIGVTLVQSLLSGVHAGATLKYVRGTLRSTTAVGSGSPGEWLDTGEDLDGGDAHGTFDLDIGVMAVGGPVSAGAVVRNVREPQFEGSSASGPVPVMRLPRQVRVGAAFDAEKIGSVPLTVSLDADLRTYRVQTGERRVIAVGAEQWFMARRLGVRGGGRFNTVGPQDRAATAGASVAIRSGLYVDGHIVRGGSADDRGWGLATRVSF
jgi:hypothetical protein